MSKRKLKLTDIAICDIGAIIDFIAIENKTAAKKLLEYMKETFFALSSHIRMGQKRPDLTDKDVMFFCIKDNYLAVFNYNEKDLVILRVLANYKDICQSIY